MKKALITGVTGQDGYYLAQFLLAAGYEVHGLVRVGDWLPLASGQEGRLFAHYGDLCDSAGITNLVRKVMPDEVYNLAAMSDVGLSFQLPEYTAQINGLGALRILEAIRSCGIGAKFFQASSADIFGSAPAPQNETTPLRPESPYGLAKLFAHWTTINYREAYGLYACAAVLMNHESPRRPENFVTRKITRAVARIQAGVQDKVYLGNLDAKRDWGYAPDYVKAMWLMLQQDEPDDFVIGTDEPHTVREFAQVAFAHAGLDWERHVEIDPRFYRPLDSGHHVSDSRKARERLRWEPQVQFADLVRLMVDADIDSLQTRP